MSDILDVFSNPQLLAIAAFCLLMAGIGCAWIGLILFKRRDHLRQ